MMITVLIVDDSATARAALKHAIESDPEVKVVGEAATGSDAIRLVRRCDPDLVTMDVSLRHESGLDVAASIMTQCAKPILIVTSADVSDPRLTFQAMEVGALELCRKLPSPGNPEYARERGRFLRLLKALSRVPVVHRTETTAQDRGGERGMHEAKAKTEPSVSKPRLVVVGASTGGPPVLSTVLGLLMKPFPLPIAVVQHISDGFVKSFVSWIETVSGIPAERVESTVQLTQGKVYLPGDDCHLRVTSQGLVVASTEPPRAHNRPSIDVLFESAARHFGRETIGVLMTGMGQDGAVGLELLRRSGAYTIAQTPESCTIDSMPRHAIERGAARAILAPDEIARTLNGMAVSSMR